LRRFRAGILLLRRDMTIPPRFSFLIFLFLSFNVWAQSGTQETAEIRGAMEFLASDAMQGRGSGSHDELLAAVYLASHFRQTGIEPGGDNGGYIQDVSGEFNFYREGKKQWNTRNVIGMLQGSDTKLKREAILLTAHMDHLGMRAGMSGDNIFNGADDDASGC